MFIFITVIITFDKFREHHEAVHITVRQANLKIVRISIIFNLLYLIFLFLVKHTSISNTLGLVHIVLRNILTSNQHLKITMSFTILFIYLCITSHLLFIVFSFKNYLIFKCCFHALFNNEFTKKLRKKFDVL